MNDKSMMMKLHKDAQGMHPSGRDIIARMKKIKATVMQEIGLIKE